MSKFYRTAIKKKSKQAKNQPNITPGKQAAPRLLPLCQAKVAARCMDGSADGSEDYLGRTVAGSDEDVCPGQRGEAARRGGADLGT